MKTVVSEALREDIGRRDLTTALLIPRGCKAKAVIVAKTKGVLCGTEVAREVFRTRDERVVFKPLKKDGQVLRRNEQVVHLEGSAVSILTAERVALNFLSRLSGISTLTRKFVEQVRGMRVKIMDTRKTTPNLRILEKYAVRVGGGWSHRRSLDEAILIKDNHLRAADFLHKGRLNEGKFKKLIERLRRSTPLKLEVEVENLEELRGVIKYKPDIVMLDNFSLAALKRAVSFRNKNYPKVKLEVSGGVNLVSLRKIAVSGVDFISVGAITHSFKSVDFSLEVITRR